MIHHTNHPTHSFQHAAEGFDVARKAIERRAAMKKRADELAQRSRGKNRRKANANGLR